MKNNKYIELQKIFESIFKNNLKVEYLHGYLSAVLCAPELIVPSKWLTLLTEGKGMQPAFETTKDAEKVIGTVMEVYNEINKSMISGSFFPLYTIKPKKHNPDIAKTWCKGFILGLNLWDTPFEDDDKATDLIMPVSILADSSSVFNAMKELRKGNYTPVDLEKLKEESIEMIPENVLELRRYYQPNLMKDIKSEKIGRNVPCPCGSGKKYKKCCGMKSEP